MIIWSLISVRSFYIKRERERENAMVFFLVKP